VCEAIAMFFGILAADGGSGPKARLGAGPRDRRITGLLQLVSIPNPLRSSLALAARTVGQRRLAELMLAIRPRDVAASWALIEEQAAYRRAFVAALDAGGFDAIVCPPLALPALMHGSSYLLSTAASYAMVFNLLGMPAGVVPVTRVRPGEEQPRKADADAVERAAREVELGSAGLPIGVQVAARAWREDIVLAVMGALEEAFRQRPEYPRLPPIASCG
jgi:fatty acid amide hydrolase